MQELFRYFGLTEHEITVYVALTRLGGAKLSTVATSTKFNRSACQEYIRSLEEKGFINSTKIGNKFLYQAEDPDMLRQIIIERMFLIDRLLPALRKKEHREDWQARVITSDEQKILIKRARKKQVSITQIGSPKLGGAVIDNKKTVLWSEDTVIPAIELHSAALAKLHYDLFYNFSKKARPPGAQH